MSIHKILSLICTILLMINHLPKIYGYITNELYYDVEKSQCSSLHTWNKILFLCPYKNSKLNISIDLEGYRFQNITITCVDDIDYKEFKQILPNITIGFVREVKIMDCPLPDSLPIASITQHIGIDEFTSLTFSNNNEWGTNLSEYHLNNLKHLRHLILQLDRVTTIPENLFMDAFLANLISLKIFTRAQKLQSNIFENLKKLQSMELEDDHLQSLPLDIFRFQNNLIELNLTNTNLKNISKDIFQYSSRLEKIYLNNNQIEMLPADVFQTLLNLSTIDIRRNSIRELPDNLLKNNKNLQYFSLTDNRLPLKSIPSMFLADLPLLTTVKLQCNLYSVPTNLFANSTLIQVISMSNNNLKYLPHELFNSQTYLMELTLSHNSLISLPEYLLKNNNKLRKFDVSYNKLQTFTNEIIADCPELQILNVNHNELTTENIKIIETGLFSRISFNLSNNLINYISKNWKLAQKMDLGNNNITMINVNDIVDSTRSQSELLLVNNNIRTITLNNRNSPSKGRLRWFYLKVKIDLNNNPISCDCHLLNFVKHIRGENLNYEFEENIKYEIKNLTCAEPQNKNGKFVELLSPSELMCDYRENCPKQCDCWIRSYVMILVINCTSLKLKSIPDLPNIEELHMNGIELNVENNQIMNLNSVQAPGYANLTKLFAAFNNLQSLEKSQLPINLTYLDVRGNNLKTLNADILTFMNESKLLREVYLSNNPWICESNNRPFIEFAKNNIQLFKDFANITCFNTAELTYFDNSFEMYLPIICIVLSAIVAALSLLMALYYIYQLEIKIWLYENNICLWFVTEHDLDKGEKYDAFISYSDEDEKIIMNCLLPELENGDPPFKLCVHCRDWPVGACIPDQIVKSVENSKRTIFLLSASFIESECTKRELKSAHKAALNESLSKVIVILYDDIDDITKLDNDWKPYLKLNTYLEWKDPMFWKKIRYAMPHIKNHNRNVKNTRLLLKETRI